MISTIRDFGSRLTSFEYIRQAKSQWSPSSRLIISLLKHKPGIRPRFFSQKIAQKEPEKKMPSTAANAIMRSAKLADVASHHLRAHCAFRLTHGTVSIARRRWSFFAGSLMYVSMRVSNFHYGCSWRQFESHRSIGLQAMWLPSQNCC